MELDRPPDTRASRGSRACVDTAAFAEGSAFGARAAARVEEAICGVPFPTLYFAPPRGPTFEVTLRSWRSTPARDGAEPAKALPASA